MACLRYLGGTSGQIRKLILVEAGLIGMLANVLRPRARLRAVAGSGLCDQQTIVRLDDPISLAGRGAAGLAEHRCMLPRCWRDCFPRASQFGSTPMEVVHEE